VCGDSNSGDSGLSCNTVDATGPCVTDTVASGSPSAATGGQIVAGTYDLTSRTIYNAPDGGNDGGARRETVVITGSGNSFTVQTAHASGTQHERQNGSVAVSGTTLVFTQTCPAPGDGGDDSSGPLGFDATTTSFSIQEMTGSGAIRVNVYTKRP